MAAVYKGVHRNGHRVAIKMLHPAISASEALRARFLREGYAANAVDHPGAVRVLDDDSAEDGSVFLVMELLEGQTLRELWERAGYRLPIQQTAAFAHQLLDVLAAAHAKGIVHRDIKPDNLFVTADGRLRVLDFGIARMRDASGSSATRTGGVMGTPAFMPREQALGWVKEIDGRTNLWAVGATIFTLVSGEMVHQADTPEHVVVLTATQPARPFGSVVAVPPAIAAVVDRSLAFAKNDRFPDARSMQQALEQAYFASFGIPLAAPAGPFAFAALAAAGAAGTPPMFGTPPVITAPQLGQLGTQTATPSASTTGGVAAARAETLVAPTSTSNRTAIVASIIAGAAIVALGATLVVRLGGSSHAAPAAEGSAATGTRAPPTPAASPTSLAPPPAATTAAPPPAAEEAATVLPAVASAAPTATSARPSREPAHTTPPAPRPIPATTAPPAPKPPAAPPAPAAPATPNCDPPWFVDPVTHGRKVKPGC